MIPNDAPEYREGAPLPGWRPAHDAIRFAIPALLPHGRAPVSEVAETRMVNAGGHWTAWDNDVAPYMREPMDATMSRRFESAVFVGPARSAKTEGMIINPLVHSILVAPRKVAVFYMSQAAAKEWSNTELGPILRASTNLSSKIRLDNVHEKTFQGGGRLTIDWPVDTKLSGRTIDLVLMADYDSASYQDVKGIGPAFAAGRKRHTSAGTRGMNVAESSPRFPILDESWSASTPHEAPPCEGILGIYNTGTRGRLYWTCPECQGEFEPTFDRLTYPDEGTPTERGAAAYMSCLHCGGVIEPHQKSGLNATARWLHEGKEKDGVVELVTLAEVEKLRPTAIVSWWLHGPAAALSSWAQIVSRYLEADDEFNRTGDEKPLKAATNLDLGLPYRPRAMGEASAISAAGLRETATDHAWQTCPAETRFLLCAVDVQAGRFVVQIMAHLADGERVLVDRFDIHTPPSTSPRAADRIIDPAKFGEDWDALFELADLSYPVANADHRLKILSVVCDAGGAAGVTPNAYAFYRKARKSHPRKFHLVRGFGGENVKRAEVKAPETAHQGKGHVAKDIMLVRAGTDRLKDEITASLIRNEAGTRAIHIPAGAPADIFEEFAAERKTDKGWKLRPGAKRNEALDLAVYDLALFIVLGCEKIDWTRVPSWAVIGPQNSFAVQDLEDGREIDVEVQTAKPTKRRKAKRRGRKFDGWG